MSPDGIEKLIRSDLSALGAYSAHKAPETLGNTVEVPVDQVIKLDANENPYGCSPKTLAALAEARNWNKYPDSLQTSLRNALQKHVGVNAERIVCSNGSGELLDDIYALFLETGDEVINCIPTFDMYRFRTLINRGKLVNVNRDSNFAIDVGKIKKAITKKTRLIVLANPNNPTGNVTPVKDLLALAETGVPLLVDEAYYEFCGETVVPQIEKYPNLMVLRTFSKWAGLAGLRIGYGIFPPEISRYLMKIKLPYNVSLPATVGVLAALQDVDYLMANVRKLITEREKLFKELKKLNWLKPYPSQANFIFCAVLKGSALKLVQALQRKGILVRYYDQPFLGNSFRVSIGKTEQMTRFLEVLRGLEAEING
ncbi:MAG: histidinol-phosphate transaminase [Dehalococcoidales bacterium]|nr:histidinol-phosphate transaminase [Dehalococcoidales bacterium]